MQSANVSERVNAKEESQLVTFLLKDEEFGFDIMSVQEIIRLPKMAKVPRSPEYVDGIANLRGVVLPIIDMRPRFGIERTDSTDRTRVLVVDIGGVKTGLRVDRVKQVTRVMRGDMETPPPAIRGTSANYLQGVVKLEDGKRIIMALSAAEVCRIESAGRRADAASVAGQAANEEQGGAEASDSRTVDDVAQLVTFRIAKEEFAFPMEHVREILRVQSPTQVPDVPAYVLGVLTVRGQILPIVDLRRLLSQPTLAEEFIESCRSISNEYERWSGLVRESGQVRNLAAPERLREWLSTATSSNQVLMEGLSRLRGINERVIKQAHGGADGGEVAIAASETLAALGSFAREIAANIHEDQRIIVVDANGSVLGLVVDHVNEVLNVPRRLLDPPPMATSGDGAKLEGVAKLDEGNRLILLLDVANLIGDQKLVEIQAQAQSDSGAELHSIQASRSGEEVSELQLVTFMLADEEYGIPISQIQEIDRLSKITKVPNVAQFVEGVTNLRGEVIPVLDTRKRFSLGAKESDDRTRIMIVELGGVKTGLIVDSVREVLSLAKRDIAPPPEAIDSGVDQQFISGIGKVDSGKRMIVLLEVEKILSKHDQARLADLPRQQ